MKYREWHMERKIPPGFHFTEQSYKLQTRSSTRMGGEQEESYWAGSLKILFFLLTDWKCTAKCEKNNTGVKWLPKISLYMRIGKLQLRQATLVYQGTIDDQEEGKGLILVIVTPRREISFLWGLRLDFLSFPEISLTWLLQCLSKCLQWFWC